MNEPPSTSTAPPVGRLVDSPWFWACLFATAAVAALVAIGPKYRQREGRLESTFLMREHLARSNAGQYARESDTDTKLSVESAESGSDRDGDGLIKSTGPLIWVLSAALVVAWSALLWSRRGGAAHGPVSRSNTQPNAAPPDG